VTQKNGSDRGGHNTGTKKNDRFSPELVREARTTAADSGRRIWGGALLVRLVRVLIVVSWLHPLQPIGKETSPLRRVERGGPDEKG